MSYQYLYSGAYPSRTQEMRKGVTSVTGEEPAAPEGCSTSQILANGSDIAPNNFKPSPEEWTAAVERIAKWLGGRGKPHEFAGRSVAPPDANELTDTDREELETAALEGWLRKLAEHGTASPTRAAARALDGWRRKQNRRRGLGLSLPPMDDDGEPLEVAGEGRSVEDAAVAAIDASRIERARPTRPARPKPEGKAAEGPGSRSVQADVWIRQCSAGDPARALRWLRCLPAIACHTRVPVFGVGVLSEEARGVALAAIQTALAASVRRDAVATARAVLRALGCSREAAKALDAHLRMRARRDVA
jgi:hypothetical protein